MEDFLLLWELLIDGRDVEIELLYCEKQPCRVLDLNFDLRGTKLFYVLENDKVIQIDITVATPFSITAWDKKEKSGIVHHFRRMEEVL